MEFANFLLIQLDVTGRTEIVQKALKRLCVSNPAWIYLTRNDMKRHVRKPQAVEMFVLLRAS